MGPCPLSADGRLWPTLVRRLLVGNPVAPPPLDGYVGALWPDGNTIAFLSGPNVFGSLGQFIAPAYQVLWP